LATCFRSRSVRELIGRVALPLRATVRDMIGAHCSMPEIPRRALYDQIGAHPVSIFEDSESRQVESRFSRFRSAPNFTFSACQSKVLCSTRHIQNTVNVFRLSLFQETRKQWTSKISRHTVRLQDISKCGVRLKARVLKVWMSHMVGKYNENAPFSALYYSERISIIKLS
jgi:hypothetical protein